MGARERDIESAIVSSETCERSTMTVYQLDSVCGDILPNRFNSYISSLPSILSPLSTWQGSMGPPDPHDEANASTSAFTKWTTYHYGSYVSMSNI